MLVTEFGITTDVNPQPKKVAVPIVVTPFGIITEVIEEQP
jgi:hypothetical protein